MTVEHEYWRERGRATSDIGYRSTDAHIAQELALIHFLQPLKFSTVLDVGCGFGRIGQQLVERRNVEYTGIDISEQRIDQARRRIPEGLFEVTTLTDFVPDEQYDLVLAVEFLMHVPPNEVVDAVAALRSMASRHVVTVDWTEPVDKTTKPHNWRHDYAALFGDALVRSEKVGLQTIHRVKPA